MGLSAAGAQRPLQRFDRKGEINSLPSQATPAAFAGGVRCTQMRAPEPSTSPGAASAYPTSSSRPPSGPSSSPAELVLRSTGGTALEATRTEQSCLLVECAPPHAMYVFDDVLRRHPELTRRKDAQKRRSGNSRGGLQRRGWAWYRSSARGGAVRRALVVGSRALADPNRGRRLEESGRARQVRLVGAAELTWLETQHAMHRAAPGRA
jgi:hypothetical protein